MEHVVNFHLFGEVESEHDRVDLFFNFKWSNKTREQFIATTGKEFYVFRVRYTKRKLGTGC